MNSKPILFNAPMVRAILSGQKTQTRRVIKRQDIDPADAGSNSLGCVMTLDGTGIRCPYGQSANFGLTDDEQRGDQLWVREKWAPDPPCDGTWGYTEWAGCSDGQIARLPEKFRSQKHCIYAASMHFETAIRWTPSIHMPRWASRITLEITDVQVERLQDISQEDVFCEGLTNNDQRKIEEAQGGKTMSSQDCFAHLWESINGAGSWDANPWVWVVSFKRVT